MSAIPLGLASWLTIHIDHFKHATSSSSLLRLSYYTPDQKNLISHYQQQNIHIHPMKHPSDCDIRYRVPIYWHPTSISNPLHTKKDPKGKTLPSNFSKQ